MAILFSLLAAATASQAQPPAPPVERTTVTVVARARIIAATRIDMSGRTRTPQRKPVRRGLIEFE